MKYGYNKDKTLIKEPTIDFNKNTPKEILQYAVGGLLYTPATNKKIGEKIARKEIPYLKSIALCLEDAIGSGQIAEAEENVKQTLLRLEPIETNELPLIFIRVREPKQMWRLYKKYGKLLEMITGFLIPKFNKDNMQDYVENFHKVKEKLESPLYILPIIESTNAIYIQNRIDNLLQIRECLDLIKDEVLNVRVGGADFSNIFGIRRKVDESIWDVRVVSNCLADIINMFSKDYVVSGAVWEYFDGKIEKPLIIHAQNGAGEKVALPLNPIEPDWIIGLRNEIKLDKLNGMIGKTCIHPKQLEIVQESLIVSQEDYNDAMQILNASVIDCGVIKGQGHGKMNEIRTHYNWAKKTINLANIYGVKED